MTPNEIEWPQRFHPKNSAVHVINSLQMEASSQAVWEFEPAERLAWSSESFGMSVYHAWRISPLPQGCHVLTEETQNGFIPRIGALLAPTRMHKFYQIWLKQLNEAAKAAA